MNTSKYLIVGAGMTGDMAAKGIREHDSEGAITMVGADPNPPYKRPLLTKGLWQGAPEEKVWREPADGIGSEAACTEHDEIGSVLACEDGNGRRNVGAGDDGSIDSH